ncbi:mitochondrial 54S ribosomal protein uL15m [Kluyveromyces lactis]|uniref:KLLA0C12133p n=1 Tax=Kluyveromyces lactis (strain ATCC 8585 / CBS 2359 / DSM 70799 / NBRC 1267 / NRRL Y-1140 / WM37) TaxID=284590 RepID=Q6CTK0_KLULA|nr:mitochondrial 54S ribosomal protein YmL10/YmL18 [Kluyveromyces lactis]CAH01590.1 KLLA0C12133p [Kluyveromyces lactis]|eukprot:XP_452739.1 mitochondrial 54S ribosomal protein YmL10/YmL18 [Kluyveromyces lactis]
MIWIFNESTGYLLLSIFNSPISRSHNTSTMFSINKVVNPFGSLIQRSFVRQITILGGLKPGEGSKKNYKRLGRGPSSGKGKTAGRGQKGQKARGYVKSWFEGGQTPIFKLFPKLGFTNVTSLKLKELNLDRITWFHQKGRLHLEPGETLTMKKMKEIGLVTGPIKDGIKILGDGKFSYNLPIKIEATRASQDAIEAIEHAGGSFTARYFNRLGLRAHLSPHWFLEKYGRVPLQARPTKRKDIEYYCNEEKRGYLIMENDPYYQLLQKSKDEGGKNLVARKTKKSKLELQLEQLENDFAPASPNSEIKSN